MDTRETAAFEACRGVIRASLLLRRELDKVFSAAGLTGPQFGLLHAMETHGPVPLSELGKRMRVSGGDVTGLVDKLVAAGYVRRARQRKDRRVVVAELTEDGREVLRELRPLHSECLGRLTIGLDEDELRELQSLLGKLSQALEGDARYPAEPGGRQP